MSNQIDSEPTIAQQITLQTGGGNQVRFGDLQLVPVADGLLWVRPFYAAVPQGSDRTTTVTEYRFVIVSYDDAGGVGESLGEALGKLFPGFEADLGDRVGRRQQPTTGGEENPPPETGEAAATPGRAAARRPTSCSTRPTPRSTPTSASTRRRSTRRRRSSTRPSSLVPQTGGLATAAGRRGPNRRTTGQRGRLSSLARRARSSRNAIW